MKNSFPGFYSINESNLRDIWLNEKTLFVFDTNCLLNLYRCEDPTRDDILNVMRKLADRIWIPFQVGLEYQRNRRKVIEESIKSLVNIKNELQKIHSQNILSSCGIKPHLYNSLNLEITELQAKIQTPIEEYIREKISPRIESKEKISGHDSIREQIDEIIRDRIGALPSQEQISAIDKEGETRYAKKQPPGFADEKKGDKSLYSNIELQDKYGDLYLWKQIIEKAKEENVTNVIFVCDDGKKDWWFIYSGKTHGVLETLKTEICRESNIENFKAINQLTFLHEAKAYLDAEIQQSSLKEVEELTSVSSVEQESELESTKEMLSNTSRKLYKKNNIRSLYNTIRYNNHAPNTEFSELRLETELRVNLSKLDALINRGKGSALEFSIDKDELMKFLPLPAYEGTYKDIVELLIDNQKYHERLSNFLNDDEIDMLDKMYDLRHEITELIDRISKLNSQVSFIEGMMSYIDRG